MPPKSRPPKKGGAKAKAMKEAAAAKKAAEEAAKAAAANAEVDFKGIVKGLDEAKLAERERIAAASGRVSTGVCTTEEGAKDVKIESFSLALHSNVLVEDTTIELNYGQRYGLVGRNGCGKSTLLRCLANREVPIPEHIDVYLLAEEAQPSELTALEYVVNSARDELARLDALAEAILTEEGPESEALVDVYERQEALDPSMFEVTASQILTGLGFNALSLEEANRNKTITLHKMTKDMSGGWRMRVALARALFIAPTMLLLDEPTNHLDLEACVWIEKFLSTYSKILIVVSHSQDFLNGVCTNTMVMQEKGLRYWGGNYDQYCSTREEQDKNQMKLYKKQQEEIKHYKEFIASCGTFSNLVRQAKSRQKVLDKMEEAGLLKPPFQDTVFRFKFPETSKPPPPLISFSDVAFSYSGLKQDYLFSGLSFGIDADSRIVLVGPNGAGKSTLLKLMVGENVACEGNVSVRGGVTLGRFNQHSSEVLDEALSPVEYFRSKYQSKYPERGIEDWRSVVGSFGIPSAYHLQPMRVLSDGLKTRVVFCEIALNKPHILLLDEPTNAADMEMIDSMAEAINAFEGGMLLISHDFRLLQKVAKEIWVVDNHKVTVWDGDIRSYKQSLSDGLNRKEARRARLEAAAKNKN